MTVQVQSSYVLLLVVFSLLAGPICSLKLGRLLATKLNNSKEVNRKDAVIALKTSVVEGDKMQIKTN